MGSVTAFTQDELDQLTDQQLKDAETLALRYSQDVMGMDIGYFARIVRALLSIISYLGRRLNRS